MGKRHNGKGHLFIQPKQTHSSTPRLKRMSSAEVGGGGGVRGVSEVRENKPPQRSIQRRTRAGKSGRWGYIPLTLRQTICLSIFFYPKSPLGCLNMAGARTRNRNLKWKAKGGPVGKGAVDFGEVL